MDIKLLEAVCQRTGKAVLATIIATQGSTPRKAGSKMLIFPDGRIVGTIGGGCAEADVRRWALTAMDDNQSGIRRVSMVNETAAEEGMVCGGTMDVFIQVLT